MNHSPATGLFRVVTCVGLFALVLVLRTFAQPPPSGDRLSAAYPEELRVKRLITGRDLARAPHTERKGDQDVVSQDSALACYRTASRSISHACCQLRGRNLQAQPSKLHNDFRRGKWGYSLARLLKIVTKPVSGMFVFVPPPFVLAIDLLTDPGDSVTTVMAACSPQTVVPFPFTTEAFWAPAMVDALANIIAVEIRNFFGTIFVTGIFVANIFVENMVPRSSLGLDLRGFVGRESRHVT
jgi:hypothetical protein